MRFRVETNLGPAMSLTSSKSSEQGLEAPEVFWVELSEYEQEFGAANPDDIVVETVDGKTVQGVPKTKFNMLVCFWCSIKYKLIVGYFIIFYFWLIMETIYILYIYSILLLYVFD